jgi:hypothetical protein
MDDLSMGLQGRGSRAAAAALRLKRSSLIDLLLPIFNFLSA